MAGSSESDAMGDERCMSHMSFNSAQGAGGGRGEGGGEPEQVQLDERRAELAEEMDRQHETAGVPCT